MNNLHVIASFIRVGDFVDSAKSYHLKEMALRRIYTKWKDYLDYLEKMHIMTIWTFDDISQCIIVCLVTCIVVDLGCVICVNWDRICSFAFLILWRFRLCWGFVFGLIFCGTELWSFLTCETAVWSKKNKSTKLFPCQH